MSTDNNTTAGLKIIMLSGRTTLDHEKESLLYDTLYIKL